MLTITTIYLVVQINRHPLRFNKLLYCIIQVKQRNVYESENSFSSSHRAVRNFSTCLEPNITMRVLNYRHSACMLAFEADLGRKILREFC